MQYSKNIPKICTIRNKCAQYAKIYAKICPNLKKNMLNMQEILFYTKYAKIMQKDMRQRCKNYAQ